MKKKGRAKADLKSGVAEVASKSKDTGDEREPLSSTVLKHGAGWIGPRARDLLMAAK